MLVSPLKSHLLARLLIFLLADSANDPSLLATFGLYTVTKCASTLDYGGLFKALSLVAIMVGPFINLVPMLPDLYEGYVSWKRLSQFLAAPKGPGTSGHTDEPPTLIRTIDPELLVYARDCSLGWSAEAILSAVTLDVKKASVTVITGDTGLGKTTLLKSLIGEVRTLKGLLDVFASRIGYCDQEPFFFPGGTIREQVLWGNTFDQTLYAAVMTVCQLDTDVEQWPDGDS